MSWVHVPAWLWFWWKVAIVCVLVSYFSYLALCNILLWWLLLKTFMADNVSNTYCMLALKICEQIIYNFFLFIYCIYIYIHWQARQKSPPGHIRPARLQLPFMTVVRKQTKKQTYKVFYTKTVSKPKKKNVIFTCTVEPFKRTDERKTFSAWIAKNNYL